MKWPNKLISLIIVTLLFSISVAAAFSVEIEAINDTILPYESATYKLTVDAEGQNEVVSIRSDTSNWILTPQAVAVAANETRTVELIITPRSGVGLSNYLVPLYFEGARSGDLFQENVFLSISVELLSKGYPPNIRMTANNSEEVDPRRPFSVSVFIKNNNLRNIDALDIYIKSDLFEETFTTQLEPLSTFRKTFTYELDNYLEPGTHDLIVRVTIPELDNKVLSEDHRTFTVKGYASVDTNRAVVQKGLFTSTEEITSVNEGNKPRTESISYAVNGFEDIFLKTTPEGIVSKASGTRELTWTFELDSEEESVITITRNYWPLVILILLIILSVIAYYIFRSPIVTIKEAQITASDKEGTQELKVRLFVKNRSRKEVSTLKIIDRVPHIAELITHAHLGTLQPTKVTKSEKRGTIIRWEIDALEPFEERIISYKIRCKLKVVGHLSLPATKIKFENMGRERITASGPGRIVG